MELRECLEQVHKVEELRLEKVVAFLGDEQGLPREKLPFVTAVLRAKKDKKPARFQRLNSQYLK